METKNKQMLIDVSLYMCLYVLCAFSHSADNQNGEGDGIAEATDFNRAENSKN